MASYTPQISTENDDSASIFSATSLQNTEYGSTATVTDAATGTEPLILYLSASQAYQLQSKRSKSQLRAQTCLPIPPRYAPEGNEILSKIRAGSDAARLSPEVRKSLNTQINIPINSLFPGDHPDVDLIGRMSTSFEPSLEYPLASFVDTLQSVSLRWGEVSRSSGASGAWRAIGGPKPIDDDYDPNCEEPVLWAFPSQATAYLGFGTYVSIKTKRNHPIQSYNIFPVITLTPTGGTAQHHQAGLNYLLTLTRAPVHTPNFIDEPLIVRSDDAEHFSIIAAAKDKVIRKDLASLREHLIPPLKASLDAEEPGQGSLLDPSNRETIYSGVYATNRGRAEQVIPALVSTGFRI
jgi:hypothetical protein